MKKYQLIIILVLFTLQTKAQWNQDTLVRNIVSNAVWNQLEPLICRDGTRGYYIGFTDGGGNGTAKIKAQRVDSAGYTLWQNNGIMVSPTTTWGYFLRSVISNDSGGVYMCWTNDVSGSDEIRIQQLDENGLPIWGNSTLIYGGQINQNGSNEKFVADGNGGIIAAWGWDHNQLGGGDNIYCQRIDNNGNKVWGVNPITISSTTKDLRNITSDNNSGIILHYYNGGKMHVQHVDSAGNLLWGNGINLFTQQNYVEQVICYDGNGGIFVPFDTIQPGGLNWDIYFHHVDSSGTILSPIGGYPIAATNKKESHYNMIPDNLGGIYVAYSSCIDSACTLSTIIAKHINSSGTTIWADTACTYFSSWKEYVKASPDGMGGVIFCWIDYRYNNEPVLYSQHYNMNGNKLWFDWGYPVTAVPNLNIDDPILHYDMVNGNTGTCVVTWEDSRTGTINTENIYMAKIDGLVTTGIANYSNSDLSRLFPNPSSGNFKLSFQKLIEKGSIEIFTVLGEIIFETNISNEIEKEINIKNPSNGIYFVKVNDGENHYCKKIIVEHD